MAANATILVSAVSFRDGQRCGYTLLTALRRARYPNRVRISVVDQALDGEDRCLVAYCSLARGEVGSKASSLAGAKARVFSHHKVQYLLLGRYVIDRKLLYIMCGC